MAAGLLFRAPRAECAWGPLRGPEARSRVRAGTGTAPPESGAPTLTRYPWARPTARPADGSLAATAADRTHSAGRGRPLGGRRDRPSTAETVIDPSVSTGQSTFEYSPHILLDWVDPRPISRRAHQSPRHRFTQLRGAKSTFSPPFAPHRGTPARPHGATHSLHPGARTAASGRAEGQQIQVTAKVKLTFESLLTRRMSCRTHMTSGWPPLRWSPDNGVRERRPRERRPTASAADAPRFSADRPTPTATHGTSANCGPEDRRTGF